jgi:hypothetical protein
MISSWLYWLLREVIKQHLKKAFHISQKKSVQLIITAGNVMVVGSEPVEMRMGCCLKQEPVGSTLSVEKTEMAG